MGLTYHLVAFPSGAADAASRMSTWDGGIAEGNGWTVRLSFKHVPVVDLATELSRESSCPALAAWLFDDDFGCIAGTDGMGTPSFALAVGEPYDAEDPFDTALAEQWRSKELRRAEAVHVATWSEAHAPTPIESKRVLAQLDQEGPFAAQGAIDLLFAALGIPTPREALEHDSQPESDDADAVARRMLGSVQWFGDPPSAEKIEEMLAEMKANRTDPKSD